MCFWTYTVHFLTARQVYLFVLVSTFFVLFYLQISVIYVSFLLNFRIFIKKIFLIIVLSHVRSNGSCKMASNGQIEVCMKINMIQSIPTGKT